ncbi:protein-tyrosine phosphatase [Agrococcus sp. UYP33]
MDGNRDGGILIVCAANVCRSPMAGLTLRRAFARLPDYDAVPVATAGVSVDGARSVCPEVASFHTSERWRELADLHRSRPLYPEETLQATLVLTASRGIRSSVVAAAPERRRRVFTLQEAVWLGSGFVVEPGTPGMDALAAFQRYIDDRRGLRQLPKRPRMLLPSRQSHNPLDIRDGHVLGAGAHRRTVRTVDEAARELASLLTGARPRE